MRPLTAKFCHQFRGVCFYQNSGGQSCLKNMPKPALINLDFSIGRLKMDVEDLNTNLSVILEGFNEEAPKRKDKSGFITRVEVYCKPNDRNNLSKNYNFSLIHPEIYDLRVAEQEKVVQEGRAEISRNVANLKKS